MTPATTRNPSVTIGMPVYNEERFIALSIESLLTQTFRDFRLVISDNASTDQTLAICEEYASNDPRIEIVKHAENLGAVRNFQFVLEGVKSTYFMWAGSHDLWESSYLEELTSALNRQPNAGLAYAQTKIVDAEGTTTMEQTSDQTSYTDSSPVVRAREIVRSLTWCNMVYGLFRTDVISKCRLDVPCLGNDHVFLMEAALRGEIHHVPNTTFVRREYRPPATDVRAQQIAQLQRILGKQDVAEHLDRRYTHWFYEHLKSAFRVPASLPVKFGRAASLGATFLDRWEPEFETSLIIFPYRCVRRCVRRAAKIRRRVQRVGERLSTLFVRAA